ncbi:MAG: hypothetical protein HY898_22575 [Deltaproteobacteria bacterium]|nr:hypothetical protein [Deltaproteobacteria bacterium]
MIKWKLVLTTLPLVALVVAAKIVMERGFGLHGWVEFGDVSAVLTAGAFLIGFMLAGTMSDFKESEKLPSELACTLETIEDLISVSACKKGFDAKAARAALLEVTDRAIQWFARKRPVGDVYAAIDGMNPHFQSMDLQGATAHANRSLVFMNTIRRIIGRIEVVSKTGFLDSGYAILEIIVTAIIVLLLASRFKTIVAEYTLITFITLVYVYMLRLIRDIDDPFEYHSDLVRRGAAEVELFPLLDYRERAAARLEHSETQ